MAAGPMRIRKDADRPKRRAGAYIGYNGYATLLACLKTPRTYVEVAEITGVYAPKLRRLLKQFHAMRLIHRHGWFKPSHGCDIPIFALGDGQDAPIPLTKAGKPQPYQDHKPKLCPRVVAFASLVHALKMGASSMATLQHESGFSQPLSTLLSHMRSPAIRLVTVTGYQRRSDGSGPWIALYEWLPDGKDAKRPGPQTPERKREMDRVRRAIGRQAWVQTVFALKRNAGFQAARI